MLQKAGFSVEAIAFERKFHKGRTPTCTVTVVGRVEHGRYFRRFGAIFRALPAIRQKLRRSQLVYASGVDMAFVCILAGWGLYRPTVLEIGDVRDVQTAKSLMGWIARRIDRWVASNCSLLVATARDFIDVYYRTWLRVSTPSMIIENKLDISSRRTFVSSADICVKPKRPSSRLRIGYFGILRWRESWDTLRSLAELWPDRFEVVIAGHPIDPPDLPEQIERYPNIRYLGEFRSPDDLPALYSSVDLIWAVYPEIGLDDWNLRWARTNRFYESCHFRTPIISRAGCKDAEEVRRLDIGLIVGSSDFTTVAEQLRRLTPEDLRRWKDNMAELPLSVSVYTDEAEALGGLLRDMLPSRSRSEESWEQAK
jgi:succinoglycan biosynthesis protein ExoL